MLTNRQQKRKRKSAAQKEFQKPVTKFEQIDLSKSSNIPNGMKKVKVLYFRLKLFFSIVWGDWEGYPISIKTAWQTSKIIHF